ncbi:MAG: trimethylamine methyltransferase family protein [Pseudomonadota bacterium]
MAEVDTQTKTAPRRRGRKSNVGAPAIKQLAWSVPRNPDAPTEPLKPEQIERLHDAAMRVLEEIGVAFLHEDARRILKTAGCDVDEDTEVVRMGRDFVMEMIAKAPSSFTITPRNPDRALTIGDGHVVFGNISSPPNCMDRERGRRIGDRNSYQELLKLTQYFNCIHFAGGYPVEPMDLHPSVRHLHCLFDKLTLTDKVVHTYSLGVERVQDDMEMARIAAGLSHEEFDAKPRLYTNINSTSPLKHDWPMLDGAMRMARRGQPVIVTPFTLAGAMAPVTIVGAVVQQVAEALAAIALLQYIKPGVPTVIGSFTSNVDMRSGAPAFGTPEYMRAQQIGGQMARYYGLPMRASHVCVSNAPDNQATWETAFSMWACVSAGVNVVYHAAGWLEGGLNASYEKFVMDSEMLQHLIAYMDGVSASEADLAVEAIREVGHNGHFFGAAHTQERFATAFYEPFASDWRNYEAWLEGGGIDATERATGIWKRILAEYEAPALDPAIRQELEEYVVRRVTEGGQPTDY